MKRDLIDENATNAFAKAVYRALPDNRAGWTLLFDCRAGIYPRGRPYRAGPESDLHAGRALQPGHRKYLSY